MSRFEPPVTWSSSARPPTRAWEVARTVVAAPSSVVKCSWELFVWGVVLVVCVCVCRCRGCCSLSVCVCDLLIFLPSSTLQNQATALMDQLAAVCNHLVAFDVQEGGHEPVASTPDMGELPGAPGSAGWGSDGSSTVSDSWAEALPPPELYNGVRRADASAYPNPPLALQAVAPLAEFGGYPNRPLIMALQSEFGAPAALHYLSSQHPHSEALRMIQLQAEAIKHTAPLGGGLESQSSFGALAAAAPLGAARTAQQPQPAAFAPPGGVYAEQYAARPPQSQHTIAGSQHMCITQAANPAGITQASAALPPRVEHAIAGSQHTAPPLGITQPATPAGITQHKGTTQAANPAGITQTAAPAGIITQASASSGIVASPSGIVSSDSGTAPTSGASGAYPGGDALRLMLNQLIAAPDAGSRASLLATFDSTGPNVEQPPLPAQAANSAAQAASASPLPPARGSSAPAPVPPHVKLEAKNAQKEQAGGGGGIPEGGVGRKIPSAAQKEQAGGGSGILEGGSKIPAGFAQNDAGGRAALLPLGGRQSSSHANNSPLPCSLPPSPPPERIEGSTGAESGPFAQQTTAAPTTPDTGSTASRRANGFLLNGAATKALAHRQRQQRPAANFSASLKLKRFQWLVGPTVDDAARLPLWRRSVSMVKCDMRSSIAIVLAAIFVNGI